jgi:16S rRNA (cytosine967-C5)-methyltransferase
LCISIITEVEDGRLLDETIDKHFLYPTTPAQFKPLIHEIVSGVVRWKLYLDWVLSHFVKEGLKKDLRYLLWISLYQAFFMEKGTHHVVNETVDHVKKEKGQRTANFVNAVLRNCVRGRDSLALPSDEVSRLSIEYSFPPWLIRRWRRRFDDADLKDLLSLFNTTPEFTLRVDRSKATLDEVATALNKAGIEVRRGRFLQSALYLDRIGPVLNSDLLARHVVHVQDETSQMAGLAAAMSVGQGTILDACAGRGTKTDQIREEAPEARIVAMDIDRRRVRSIRSANLGVRGDVLTNPFEAGAANLVVRGDIMTNPFKTGVFDSILLDAPCSSLGIIRKHPEIRWRRSEREIAKFADVQKEMARSLSKSLRSGGFLIYSVCSFEPEETVEVVKQLQKEGLFSAENPLPGVLEGVSFLSVPHRTSMDGFFISRLRKL